MRMAKSETAVLVLVVLSALDLNGAAGESRASLSWEPEITVTELSSMRETTDVFITLSEASGITDAAFDIVWSSHPDSGIVEVVQGREMEEDGTTRVVPLTVREKVPAWSYSYLDGLVPGPDGSVRIRVSLRFSGFGSATTIWLSLARLMVEQDGEVKALETEAPGLTVRPNGLVSPPVITRVSPPTFLSGQDVLSRALLEGRRLNSLSRVLLLEEGGVANVTGDLSNKGRSTADVAFRAAAVPLTAWVILVEDSLGRVTCAPQVIWAGDPDTVYFDEEGDVVDDLYWSNSEHEIADRLLIWTRPGALRFPHGETTRPVPLSALSCESSLLSCLSSIGTGAVEVFAKSVSEASLWSPTLPDGRRRGKVDLRNVFVLSPVNEVNVQSAISALRSVDCILWAEPCGVAVSASEEPNDPRYFAQWALNPSAADPPGYIGVREAWNTQTGGEGVRIGIIDSGIDYGHPEFGGGFGSAYTVKGGYDYRDNDSDPMDCDTMPEDCGSHGTKVAGTCAARTSNATGIAGVAGGWWNPPAAKPGCSLYAFRAGHKESWDPCQVYFNFEDWGPAMMWGGDPSAYDCDILNCSFGWGRSSLIGRAVTVNAYCDLALVVCAKGNEGTSDWHYPSDYHLTMGIGACDENGDRAIQQNWASNWGNGMDLLAPGVEIPTTLMTVNISPYTFEGGGTSQAAPHVAGVSGLLVAEMKEQGWEAIFPDDVRWLLKYSARDIPPEGYDDEHGFGVLDAATAMEFLEPPYVISLGWAESGTPAEDDRRVYHFFPNAGGELEGDYLAQRYTVRDTIRIEQTYADPPKVWPIEILSDGWEGSIENLQGPYVGVTPTNDPWEWAFETFVFFVESTWPEDEPIFEWYPCAPSEVKIAYRTLGIPCVGVPSEGVRLEALAGKMTVEPNPFNATTVVRYFAPIDSHLRVRIVDVSGRLVATLMDRNVGAGEHVMTWNGRDNGGREIASGVYVVKLEAGGEVHKRKVVLVR